MVGSSEAPASAESADPSAPSAPSELADSAGTPAASDPSSADIPSVSVPSPSLVHPGGERRPLLTPYPSERNRITTPRTASIAPDGMSSPPRPPFSSPTPAPSSGSSATVGSSVTRGSPSANVVGPRHVTDVSPLSVGSGLASTRPYSSSQAIRSSEASSRNIPSMASPTLNRSPSTAAKFDQRNVYRTIPYSRGSSTRSESIPNSETVISRSVNSPASAAVASIRSLNGSR